MKAEFLCPERMAVKSWSHLTTKSQDNFTRNDAKKKHVFSENHKSKKLKIFYWGMSHLPACERRWRETVGGFIAAEDPFPKEGLDKNRLCHSLA